MKSKWPTYAIGVLASFGLVGTLSAQPVTPPTTPPAETPAAAAGAGGFMAMCGEKLTECKDKICAMPMVQAMLNGLRPMTGMAGLGDLSCCPPLIGTPGATPTKEQLEAGGAVGTAAAIMKSEAEAKARRAAVRYLGTVDCRHWPEAETQLIKSLRTDPNECVRWEAALALSRGCCCNKNTIAALTDVLSEEPKDKHPVERSERVRAAAAGALGLCLATFTETVPEKPEKPETPTPPVASAPGMVHLTALEAPREQQAMRHVVDQARRTMSEYNHSTAGAVTLPSGKRNLFDIAVTSIRRQRGSKETAAPQSSAPAPAAPRLVPVPVASPPTLKPTPPPSGPVPSVPVGKSSAELPSYRVVNVPGTNVYKLQDHPAAAAPKR